MNIKVFILGGAIKTPKSIQIWPPIWKRIYYKWFYSVSHEQFYKKYYRGNVSKLSSPQIEEKEEGK